MSISPSQIGVQPAPILTLEGVTKRFPGVVASDDVSLQIYPGEVHVLLGENGAGKSTLIGILSGLQQPDEGRVLIDGKPVVISSPKQALAIGIGTVFQHTLLVPTLTVAENLLLGAPWWQRPKREALRGEVETLVDQLGIRINLDARASELSLGEQQQVEILRALLRHSRILILDESTSMLSPAGIEELGALMRRLVARGMAIIFISHKLREAAAFGDRVSVLKLGRKVGEIAPERFAGLSETALIGEIVELMFGRRDRDPDNANSQPRMAKNGPSLVSVRDLTIPATPTTPGLKGISFDLAPGEILGIAGIDGNGQKQLAEALAGQHHLTTGEIRLGEVRINHLPVSGRRAHGLRYVTDDRLAEGSVGSFPIATNVVLKQVGERPYWNAGIEHAGRIEGHAVDIMRRFDVRAPGPQTPIGRLSGGNIQKVLVGRELSEGARFIIFNKPTYGLDIANTLATRDRIAAVAASGISVLLISTELDELIALSDRIAVMVEGTIVGVVANGAAASAEVGRLMIGLAA